MRTGALIALLLCVSVQASAQPAVTPTARTTPSPELDLRLGKGVGAVRERAKLKAQMNEGRSNQDKAVTRRGRKGKKGRS